MKGLRKIVAAIGAVILTAVAVAVPVMSLNAPAVATNVSVHSSASGQVYDHTVGQG